ncbi:MAG: DUF5110 domain-containing protein [Firmicutes bacterium]|nr:DUF5110 domain-containing protein [Bacillota bacterium]
MIRKTNYGYVVDKNNVFLHIGIYSSNVIRLAYTNDNSLPNSTFAVIKEINNIEASLDGNKIMTENLDITIDDVTLKVSIFNKEGVLLSKDRNIDINMINVEKEILWEQGFYGLGEKYGWMNHKGSKFSNWNTDVLGVTPLHNATVDEYHTSIPFYIGLDRDKAYGIYFDNSFRTKFDFGREVEDILSFSAEDGIIDYYFIYGEKVSNVISGFTDLTGNMPLPRKEFLGFQQCRWSYENREELIEVAHKMREENIPCDVLYLDIDYMKDYKVFTIDSKKFSEFKEMISHLKSIGYKVVVIIDPGVKVEKNYWVYEEGMEKDYFVKDSKGDVYIGEVWPGDSVFPDFLRSEVRKWWGALHKELIMDGIEGIWNDMNEPANFNDDSKTIPKDTIHIDDNGDKKEHKEIHNLYGFYEAEATYNGLLEIQPEKRPFVLTRAAFAGTQRYSALWTGDNHSIWEHMESSIPMFMNLGLSGYTFIGADVGGFAGDSNGELLTRWTQLGVFTPLFRNHSAKDTLHQEPWCFERKYTDIIRKYTELRYRFISYLYNLMRESSLNGSPVIRPLFYHYQQDEKTYNINDQFLFGKDIMVCPIVKPGMTKRMVYLPEGEWYDYWTKEKLVGGEYIIADAPLDIIPIYIKAGGIIPEDEVSQFISNSNDILYINIYKGEESKSKIYFDDGTTFNYKEGLYSEIEIAVEEEDNHLNISLSIDKDNYRIPKIKLRVFGWEDKNSINLDFSEIEVELI